MKKWKKITLLIVGIAIVVGGITAVHTYHEKQWLQQNIDHIFTLNFSNLNANQMIIALNPDMSEQEQKYYQEMVTKSGYVISQLFSSTSYRESIGVNVIVGLLDQATGTDALNNLNMTKELNQKLNELQMCNFSEEPVVSETLEMLKKCIESK